MIIPYRINKGTTGDDGDGEENDLEGATVLEPIKGFYDRS